MQKQITPREARLAVQVRGLSYALKNFGCRMKPCHYCQGDYNYGRCGTSLALCLSDQTADEIIDEIEASAYTKAGDKVLDIINEFGDNPKAAIQILEDWFCASGCRPKPKSARKG